jgi:hypothetical protein
MKISVILGTHPEIIKMAPLLKILEAKRRTSSYSIPASITLTSWTKSFSTSCYRPDQNTTWRQDLKHDPKITPKAGIPLTIAWTKSVYDFK